MSLPSVEITVADNGANAAIVLPQQKVQVKIGCAIGGTVNVPFATSSPTSLAAQFVAGPLVESGGLVCQAGGTVIAVSCPVVTKGTATAVVPTIPGTSSSAVTVTLDSTFGAYDDTNVRVRTITGGTRGTTGVQLQFSLDAGRTWGPLISIGTATTYVIPNTGITVNFGAGTLVAGDYWSFSTYAPAWDTAGVQAALAALAASPFGVAGWGSLHIVGVTSAAQAASFQTYLESLATNSFIFTRAITDARDAVTPVAWGGSGETEAAWMSSVETAFASNATKRVVVGAGYYNTPSPYPNAIAGAPSYRRPLGWSAAVRRVLVPPQRQGGRVKDGSLSTITVNPASDPGDGFVYHDERAVQGFDAARFMSAITWAKNQGFFIAHENLMSGAGSQFTWLVLGNVIDVACDIGYATGVEEISDDLTLQDNGTLETTDALQLQSKIDGALKAGMTSVSMVSNAFSSVDQAANVRATSKIPIDISVNPRGYVNQITETINLVP